MAIEKDMVESSLAMKLELFIYAIYMHICTFICEIYIIYILYIYTCMYLYLHIYICTGFYPSILSATIFPKDSVSLLFA